MSDQTPIRFVPRAAGRRNGPPRTHVFIIDGTLSSLEPGRETHAGRLYKLLGASGPRASMTVGYHPGVQGAGLSRWVRAALGTGVNDAIRDGYAALASRYRPGDRIFLFGYSRGAFAVRSLAGLIDRIGLLRAEAATERRVERAFRYYEGERPARILDAFRAEHCHTHVDIEMVGAWDTVKALGLPYPLLSRFSPMAIDFHDCELGYHVRNGFHALALDETRTAFKPFLWKRNPGWRGRLEQVWFPGRHGDVGGDVSGYDDARPLSNLSFQWLLERAEGLGLDLPAGWRDGAPCDPAAPMTSTRRGISALFLLRAPRRIPEGHGHALHPSVAARCVADARYRPAARIEAEEKAAEREDGPEIGAEPIENPPAEAAFR